MMDTAGAFVGVCIGAALVWKFPSELRNILLLTAIPGFVALGITFLVREPKGVLAKGGSSPLKLDLNVLKPTWPTFTVLGLFGIANSSDTYLLLYAGLKGVAPFQIIMLYALFNLIYAAASSPLGIASDKVGAGKILLIGWALFGVCYLLYGLSVAATDGISKAYLVQAGSTIPKGTLIGAQYFVIGLTTLAGNLIAGIIWAKASPEAMLLFGGWVAMVSAVGLGLLLHSQKKAVVL